MKRAVHFRAARSAPQLFLPFCTNVLCPVGRECAFIDRLRAVGPGVPRPATPALRAGAPSSLGHWHPLSDRDTWVPSGRRQVGGREGARAWLWEGAPFAPEPPELLYVPLPALTDRGQHGWLLPCVCGAGGGFSEKPVREANRTAPSCGLEGPLSLGPVVTGSPGGKRGFQGQSV